MSIDYLIIGHVTQDITPAGVQLGGTALYSTVTAQRLGCKVALVTRAPVDLDLRAAMPDVELHVLPTERATTFENIYRENSREQYLHHVAPALSWEDIPLAWRRAAIVHLAPVAQEVALSLTTRFPEALLCATPQGWTRKWDQNGRVHHVLLEKPQEVLQPVDVLIFSAEDVNHDPAAMRVLIQSVPTAVVTHAAEGAIVYTRHGSTPLPARRTTQIDPTGAGDVFAAAFLVRLHEQGDPFEAAAFANVVASFSIEAWGVNGIPTRDQVDEWFAAQLAGRGPFPPLGDYSGRG
ncbi:MAG: PfkB family carbohydrate kinase [Ardenticatenaceae bacterium]